MAEQLSVATLLEADAPVGEPLFGWAEEQPLHWQLNPGGYTDAEAISVNVNAIRRVLRVAGFSSLHVKHSIEESDPAKPDYGGIGGVASDGTAVATGTSRQHIKPKVQQNILTSDLEKNLEPDYVWPQLTLNIDRLTMGSTISDLRLRHPRMSREQAWAKTIDNSLRTGIRQATKQHLMPTDTGINTFNTTLSGFWLYNVSSDITFLATSPGYHTWFTAIDAAIYGLCIGTIASANRNMTGKTHIERKRYSTSPMASQVDRYLATVALTGVQKLVKATT